MKLWTLNKVFRLIGFVLVIKTNDAGPTEIYFQTLSSWNKMYKPRGKSPIQSVADEFNSLEYSKGGINAKNRIGYRG